MNMSGDQAPVVFATHQETADGNRQQTENARFSRSLERFPMRVLTEFTTSLNNCA